MQWLIILVSYAMFLYLLVIFISKWEHVAILLGIVVSMGCAQTLLSVIQMRQGNIRPSGTFFNPNFLAGYVAAAWTLTLSYLSYQSIRRTRDQLIHGSMRPLLANLLLPVCLATVLTGTILWTGSRGGLLAAGIGASVVIGLRFGRRAVVLFMMLVLIGLAAIPNPMRERMYAEHAFNPVTYARLEMWEGALRSMVDHPMGVGIGLYQYTFPQYAFPVESQIARYGTVAQTPHNEFLQIGVELGVASLLLVGWGLWILTKEIRWVLNQRMTRFQRELLVGVAGGIAGLLAHAAVDSNLHEPALAILLMLFVAIVVASRGLLDGQPGNSMCIPLKNRSIWIIGAVLIMVSLAVVVVRLGVAWMWYESGTALLKKNDVDGALTHYETAIAIDPGKALYHSALAAANFQHFEHRGDLTAAQMAVDHLNEAIMLNPLDGRLAGLLGKVHLKVSSNPAMRAEERHAALLSAGKAYERAISAEPFNALHYWGAGQVQMKLGDHRRAQSLIRHAVDIEPNFLPGRDWLARMYLEEGQMSLSQAEYREIVERQNRYRDWKKSPLEKAFLTADATTLAAASQIGGGS
jgi:tetratricopeptide (TPR) repeat protein